LPDKHDLLAASPKVINVGLEVFADTLHELGFPVVQVDWRPPAGGDRRLTDLLSRLNRSGDSDSEGPN
jgi:FdrA protein